MKKKVNNGDSLTKTELLLVLYGISVFVINTVLRKSLYFIAFGETNLYATTNLFSVVILIILLNSSELKNKNTYWGSLRIKLIIFYAILCVFSNITGVHSQYGGILFCTSILPAFIIISFCTIKINFNRVFSCFVKIINYTYIPILGLGIIDYFLGGVINVFIALQLSPPDWANMIISENYINGFRMCTIIGSPLMNGYYALLLLVLNVVHNQYIGRFNLLNRYVLYIFVIITIILTGSRSAFVCACVFMFIVEINYKLSSLPKLLPIALLVYYTISSDFFSATIGVRFLKEGDVRFSLWEKLLNGDYGQLHLLQGGGAGYSRYLTGGGFSETTNFEYPWLMFAFDYGVIATVLYYLLLYISPMINLFKRNESKLVIAYSALFLVLQTCNLTAGFYDFNLQYGFLLMCFLGLSNNSKYKKIAI